MIRTKGFRNKKNLLQYQTKGSIKAKKKLKQG